MKWVINWVHGQASVDQIAALLQITLNDNGDGTRSYDVSINMAIFSDFLQTLAPGLITPAQNGRFHFNEATGQLEVIVPSISGRELNIEETLARLQEGVFSADNRTVPMAFNYTLATYHNQVSAAELGIVQMVAESTTYFTGSEANRRTNIAVSASRFDGIIIGPGEEFSFNYHLGDISLENGFVDGKVIFGGRTVTGVGGGVWSGQYNSLPRGIRGRLRHHRAQQSRLSRRLLRTQWERTGFRCRHLAT